jgi:hypothetical protein
MIRDGFHAREGPSGFVPPFEAQSPRNRESVEDSRRPGALAPSSSELSIRRHSRRTGNERARVRKTKVAYLDEHLD